MKQKPQNSLSPGNSKIWSDFFVLSILPDEILRISFRLQFYLIKRKQSKSERNSSCPVIFKAQKRQTTFCKFQIQGYFVFYNSIILLIRLVYRIYKCRNYVKDQRKTSNRLATVMFRGTPCILHCNSQEGVNCTIFLQLYYFFGL